MLNQNILLYGHETLPPAPMALRAGDLSMEFEPDTAFLRYIRRGDAEIVRCIYAVVRDGNWNTIPWQVKNLQMDVRQDSFEIKFEVDCTDGQIEYHWRGAACGTADGRVSYTFDGRAESEFLRNRIGICVLHPGPEFGGKPCTLEHTNGAFEQCEFPKLVAPWQPFLDVRAITTEVAPGVRGTVRLEGDIFETEDQRNYGDASFKTYSTPQDLPKPVQVRAGDSVQQTASVSLSNPGNRHVVAELAGHPAVIRAVGEAVPKPNIGLQWPREGKKLTDMETTRLHALRLGHLRADIFLAQADWPSRLEEISVEASRLDLPLHVALHLGVSANSELNEFVRAAQGTSLRVALWIVQRHGESFPSAETLEIARKALAKLDPKVPLAGTASPFFTEFNRNRPEKSDALICYPHSPQVHLTDRSSVMENLADVAETIHTARALTGGPVIVSPISLKRAEPKASRQGAGDNALPATVDERQMSLFTAAWTVGHLAQLNAQAGLHSATYYETIGWRGVMESAEGSPLPTKFFSIPGGVFPVYHVFAAIAPFTHVRRTTCSRPLVAAGLTLARDGTVQRTLVANLLATEQEISVQLEGANAQIKRLNATNAEEAMRTPESFGKQPCENVRVNNGILTLKLAAYEIAQIDF